MNEIERMEFLTERMKDGKEFLVGGYETRVVYNHNYGMFCWNRPTGIEKMYITLNEMLCLYLSLLPAHLFTDDEKAIMRNLPFDYIVRDFDGELWNYEYEPFKMEEHWEADGGYESSRSLYLFEHLFESIKFENEEPLKISEYMEKRETK